MTAATQHFDIDADTSRRASPPPTLPAPVVSLATPVVLPFRQEQSLVRSVQPHASEPLVDDSHLPLYDRRLTVLPNGWLFSGQIHTDDPITVNCQIVGDVTVTHGRPCVLEPESHVEGTVNASVLEMHGTLKGNVNAVGGKVVIHPTAQITGELRYTDIAMLGGVHHMQLVYAGGQS